MEFIHTGGLRYLTFDIFPSEVVHAVFTRQGGVSPEPWQSLNVGGTVGDERSRVRENRYRSFHAVGRQVNSLFDVWQVHSADVVLANAPHPRYENPPEFKADAIITDNPAVTLFMRFADCTPILLYDPRKRAVGIVHAGWLGTVRRAAGETVKAMRAAFGSKPSDILAAIGPSIGPDHYEVGNDVETQVRYAFGKEAELLLHRNHGPKAHFDLWMANQLVLRQAGVEQIQVAGLCTACHPADWYSHRAQKGKTGRFGALIALRQ
ncbi:MAG: peptidoglycan editing factor PgeF [Anaerolineae bacterium]|nr:MAG: peptidoglycan editing factor PgeF [Anaerolineae bacterium]